MSHVVSTLIRELLLWLLTRNYLADTTVTQLMRFFENLQGFDWDTFKPGFNAEALNKLKLIISKQVQILLPAVASLPSVVPSRIQWTALERRMAESMHLKLSDTKDSSFLASCSHPFEVPAPKVQRILLAFHRM